ncbi:hypothetical protein CPC08DRAFT_421336 [Agrocybe pediades]|nr:hypothetical protein CPC08DRAFT_421336 [Agrocybe pediades]
MRNASRINSLTHMALVTFCSLARRFKNMMHQAHPATNYLVLLALKYYKSYHFLRGRCLCVALHRLAILRTYFGSLCCKCRHVICCSSYSIPYVSTIGMCGCNSTFCCLNTRSFIRLKTTMVDCTRGHKLHWPRALAVQPAIQQPPRVIH